MATRRKSKVEDTIWDVLIIGGGIGGLGLAALTAKKGMTTLVLEKNKLLGGRMNMFRAKGFMFDMGPSWYLMPDVFDHYFSLLGESPNKLLKLEKLTPSYRVFFKDTGAVVDMESNPKKVERTLEKLEPGSSLRFREYLRLSEYQYEIAKKHFMYKNYDSIFDFMNWRTVVEGTKLNVFTSMQKYVERFFSSDAVQKLMQYTLVFLGSSPYNTPALYNIMSHIDFNLGAFYPRGGMYEIVKAVSGIAKKHGAKFQTETEVNRILVERGRAVGVELKSGKKIYANQVVSNADVHHTDTQLLSPEHRQHTQAYWNSRTLAPSALIMYLGVNRKYENLVHHNLLFSKDWQKNFGEIFDSPQWPTDPSLYVSCPSRRDETVASRGQENIFVLVPIAAGLKYTEKQLETYADKILETMETSLQLKDLRKHIIYKRLYSVKDFERDYHSFQGTALGLAHTLTQTAIFRQNNVHKKIKNLLYVGAGTNPGIGVPICLISAELAYKRLVGNKSEGPLEQL